MSYKVAVIIILLFTVLVYIALTNYEAGAPSTGAVNVVETANTTVKSKSNTRRSLVSDGFIMFDYTEPEWLSGHIKEDEINTYIQRRHDTVRAEAMDLQKELKETALLPYQLNINLERTIGTEYESILLVDYSYTGGAHGITAYKDYNLKNGGDVALEEYLTSIGFTEEQLLTHVNERLSQDKHETVENFNDAFWQMRVIEETGQMGIEILFPQYVVASYSAGTITYTIFPALTL